MQAVTLAEARSKALLASHGLEIAVERIVDHAEGAVAAAESMGVPVVVKLNGDRIAHKMPTRLVHGIAAVIFAVLGIATLVGMGERFGI